MKKLITLIAMFTLIHTLCNAQSADTSAHDMLNPDAATVYLDENGKQLTSAQFADFIKTGHYSFKPMVENGRVKNLQLKKAKGNLDLGALAPDFSVTTLAGNKISINNLAGKTIVLNFWFTTCMPCRTEMPELNDLTEKYKNDPKVLFLAVTFDSDERVKAFLAGHAFSYNIAAGQRTIVKQYGITAFPTNMIIDKTGHIAFMLTAYAPDNIQKLDKVLTELEKI